MQLIRTCAVKGGCGHSVPGQGKPVRPFPCVLRTDLAPALGSKTGRGALTKRQAEAALRDFRREAEQDAARSVQSKARRPTLATIAHEHLDHLETSDTKASTIADYRGYLRRHVLPYFGKDTDIRKIRVRDVEAFVAHQRKPTEKDGSGGKGLKGSTVLNQVNYLHAIFAFAQRREEVEINPVAAASKPKTTKPTSDFSFLSPAQVDAVIDASLTTRSARPTARSS